MSEMSSDEKIKKLESCIKKHFLAHDVYHFRPIKIDGISMYIVLYGKHNLLNVESIYVSCNAKVENTVEKQQYSLYHYRYKTLGAALKRVEKINKEYRIYNGELVSATDYEILTLEELILPFPENESCTICYENTSDITSCGHSICLNCRETCILRKHVNCPVCRKANVLEMYMNQTGLVNNDQYSIVRSAIHFEKTNSEDDYIPFSRHDIFDEEEEEEEGEPVNDTIPQEQPIDSVEVYEVFWRISRTPSVTQDNEVNNINSPMYLGFNNIDS